jgi:hypothetical protein
MPPEINAIRDDDIRQFLDQIHAEFSMPVNETLRWRCSLQAVTLSLYKRPARRRRA